MPITTACLSRRLFRAATATAICCLLLAPTAVGYVTLRPPCASSMTRASLSSSPPSSTATSSSRSSSNVVHTDTGLLIKNYRPLPPSDDDPLDVRCALLHISARKALKSGKMEIARRFYELFLFQWKGYRTENAIAHTYFLWALLEQRAKDYTKARRLFQEATERYPTHARLLQAWALMESKCGKLEEAQRLIKEAVENDKSLEPVLKWKMWGLPPATAAAAAAIVTAGTAAPGAVGIV
ncbi:tpr repeat-containing protein [Nannochloropsis oceanica]